AARRRGSSGDADLSRQCAVDGPELGRRYQPRQRSQRESGARNPRASHPRRPQRLHPGRCHQPRQVLTGWSLLPTLSNPDRGGEFLFFRRMHEPGPQTVIGKTYADTGVEQGRAVLADLARHPATARHVAIKLARHFIADDPPPALVDRLASRYLDTEGDLKEVARALVAAPEAWTPEQAKIKRPAERIAASLRA